ncbi:hypothetical protein HYT23_06820 [Candidatus Pacearchaeota archaeon]|nr:hypothetical protein [Candidatus Pacearchaeota archaeon]
MTKTLVECMCDAVVGRKFRHKSDDYGPAHTYVLVDICWLNYTRSFFARKKYLDGSLTSSAPIIMNADDILED